MKAVIVALFICFAALDGTQAQTPPAAAPPLPNLPDETVVAVFEDGTRFTMGELKLLLAVLPEQGQAAVINRKGFIQWWAGMRNLAAQAEKDKLDQKSPVKEQLEYNKVMVLGQAKLNDELNTIQVSPEEVAKFYEANKERFKQVKVKALYISFGSAKDSKKPLTEEQAKAKAEKLLAKIRGGADFVALVRENSDDATSRAKDGDFATLHPKDNIPDAIRAAVFAIKKGEVSEPVRQPGGYYLLRAEDVTYTPLEKAHNQIYAELRQQRYVQWLSRSTAGIKVEFPNPEFLGEPASPSK